MKAGRKNLKQASKRDGLSLQEGQSIMQVISLRGSNQIDVVDAKGVKSLANFRGTIQKTNWIKTGNFVVVDESGREKALVSGSKISCLVSQVLSHDQVRILKKSSEWPTTFRTSLVDDLSAQPQQPNLETEEVSSSEEDGLPPLEANLNRNSPLELYSDSDSEDDLPPAEENLNRNSPENCIQVPMTRMIIELPLLAP